MLISLIFMLLITANKITDFFSNAKTTLKHSDYFRAFSYTNLRFTHAESPVWDPRDGTLYWVDVLNQNVHSLQFSSNRHRVKHVAYGEINVVLPIANSSRLLVGVRSEVFLLDWTKPGDSCLRLLAVLDLGQPDNILNEGKADAYGRFWVGTKGPQHGDTVPHDEAALYSLEQPNFTPQVQLKPVSVSNGLMWALNNTLLYYIDSETQKIEAFDFDLESGRIKNRRTIFNVKEHGFRDAIPDGMTIDRDGMLWVALYINGTVIRVDPNAGSILEQYQLPVTRTTSLAWCGPNLEELAVTTSRRNLSPTAIKHEPLSGAIFFLRQLGTGGVPNHKFVFDKADSY